MRGGTTEASQSHLLWIALLLAALLLPAARHRYGNWRKTCRRLVADPVFWAGGLFLALLTAQWLNAGQSLFFNPIRNAWETTFPTTSWLPFAFVRGEALEMLRWFAPAVHLLLAVRHGLGRRKTRQLARLLAVNAALLAVFGIVKYARGVTEIHGQPFTSHFFATFGYANHAGAFFLLGAGLSLGLLFRTLNVAPDMVHSEKWMALWGGAFTLCFFGTVLSLSRSAMFFAMLLLVVGGICLFVVLWPRLRPRQRFNLLTATAMFACLCFFVADSFAKRAIASQWGGAASSNSGAAPARPPVETAESESSALFHVKRLSDELVCGRAAAHQAAIGIWRDYPWFGCGGWGFAHLLISQIPPDQPGQNDVGQANVHSDPLQFLAEFGLIGFGLMLSVVTSLLFSASKSGCWRRLPAVPVLTVAGMVAVHSLVDLPFRCPAVLYMWLAALAVLPAIAETGSPGRLLPSSPDTPANRH